MILSTGETSICIQARKMTTVCSENHLTNYNFAQLQTFLKRQVLSTLFFEEAAREDQILNCSEQEPLDHGPR